MSGDLVPDGTLLGSPAPGSQEWHDLRSGGVGASEVAGILGISPWESPYSLHHRRRGGWTIDETEPMRWGTLLEPVVMAEWARRRGWSVMHAPGVYAHREHQHHRCSPDGLVLHPATDGRAVSGVEVKTSRMGDGWGPDGTDEVPAHYRAQVAWQMHVTGLRTWHLVVLIGGSDLRAYELHHDPADEAWIVAQVDAWWADLQAGVAPPLDGTVATLAAVRQLHPGIDPEVIADIDGDTVSEWRDAQADSERAARRLRAAQASVLDQMGTARIGATDGRRVARRQPGARGSVQLRHITQEAS